MGCPPASAVPAGAHGPATITVTLSPTLSRGWARSFVQPSQGLCSGAGNGAGH